MSIPIMLPKIRDPYYIGRRRVTILTGKHRFTHADIIGYGSSSKRNLRVETINGDIILINRSRVAWEGMKVRLRGMDGEVTHICPVGDGGYYLKLLINGHTYSARMDTKDLKIVG